jgi:hypothetical protein
MSRPPPLDQGPALPKNLPRTKTRIPAQKAKTLASSTNIKQVRAIQPAD